MNIEIQQSQDIDKHVLTILFYLLRGTKNMDKKGYY